MGNKIHGMLGLLALVAGLFAHPVGAQSSGGTVVEYLNIADFPSAPGGHFFYSSDPGEQASVDSGAAGRFKRTGLVFYTGGETPVCRFYGSVSPGPNSHFFTANSDECAGLRSVQIIPTPADRQQWNYEGLGFNVVAKPASGTCPAGTVAVHRAYNNGFTRGVDSNHRYSTSRYALDPLVDGAGWAYEGVVFCSQLPAGQAPLISEALGCGTLNQAPPEIKADKVTTPLQRHTIDLLRFPDAVCNDGTAAVLYFRPYVGEAYRNRWIFDIRGGGSCETPETCAQRWCGVDTNFNMGNMTANVAPASKIAGGILARESDSALAATNPHQNYNHVEVRYCSSDGWTGTARDVSFDAPHPTTGATTRMRMHFLGAKVFDAFIDTLRRDGVPALSYVATGGSLTLPDLDDADEVILAGPSGGGNGVTYNLDRMAQSLRAANTKCSAQSCSLVIRGLIDSIFGPTIQDLDFTQVDFCTNFGVCTPEAYLRARQTSGMGKMWKARLDQSCMDLLGPSGNDWRCFDGSYVRRNHISTPFFVRMGLTDQLLSSGDIEAKIGLPGQGPFTLLTWAQKVRSELLSLASIKTTAYERDAISVVPGVFAPNCSKHDTLESNPSTYQTTVQFSSRNWALFDAWNNWVTGQIPASVVSSSTTDSSCAE